MRFIKESAPTHRIFLFLYLTLTVLILIGVNIKWFGNPFYDKFISLVILWFFYPFLAFALEHKHSNKTAHMRARKVLGDHVDHLTDDQLKSHTNHK